MQARKIIIYLFLFLIFIVFPLYDVLGNYKLHSYLIKFIESKGLLYLLVYTIFTIPIILWFINSYYKDKLFKEKQLLFEATIHSMQDLLHNHLSSLQLIMLEFEDKNISNDIIKDVEDAITQTKLLSKKISDMDLKNINLEKLTEDFSIIQFIKS